MRYIMGLIIIAMGMLLAVPIAFALGFMMQMLLNPILLHIGFKTVTTTLCACIILLIGLLKLIF